MPTIGKRLKRSLKTYCSLIFSSVPDEFRREKEERDQAPDEEGHQQRGELQQLAQVQLPCPRPRLHCPLWHRGTPQDWRPQHSAQGC
jgi:hypothetical protein